MLVVKHDLPFQGKTWEEPSVDQCWCRGKLLTCFQAIGVHRPSLKRMQILKGLVHMNLPWNSYGPMAPKCLWKFTSTVASVHRVLLCKQHLFFASLRFSCLSSYKNRLLDELDSLRGTYKMISDNSKLPQKLTTKHITKIMSEKKWFVIFRRRW